MPTLSTIIRSTSTFSILPIMDHNMVLHTRKQIHQKLQNWIPSNFWMQNWLKNTHRQQKLIFSAHHPFPPSQQPPPPLSHWQSLNPRPSATPPILLPHVLENCGIAPPLSHATYSPTLWKPSSPPWQVFHHSDFPGSTRRWFKLGRLHNRSNVNVLGNMCRSPVISL